MIAKTLLLTLFVISAFSEQMMDIPNAPDGYSIGGGIRAPVRIEAFFDLLCPDSLASWNIIWPILTRQFDIWNNQTLRFTVHGFPLNYHRNAHIVHQGLNIIRDNAKNASDVWTYIDLLFKNQGLFQNNVTANMTFNQVKQALTALVISAMPQYGPLFLNGLAYENMYDEEARSSWSYAVSRSVTGTPVFYANGVYIDGGDSLDANTWIEVFKGNFYVLGQRHSQLTQIEL